MYTNMLKCFSKQHFSFSWLNNTCQPSLAPFFMNWLPPWRGSQFHSSTSQRTVSDAMSTTSRQSGESGEWLAFSEPWQTFLPSKFKKTGLEMTVQQHSRGKIPSSHGRDVRRMAGKKGLFLISLIVLWVSWPGSWLWAGPALDKAVEGPSCFLPPTPSVSMYPLSLPHCKDWIPTWLVFAFVWDVRVKRECWGQPRVSDLGVWHKAEESVFELFPWWFWRAARLKKHRQSAMSKDFGIRQSQVQI